MEQYITERLKISLKILGWYQIIGGVLGIGVNIWMFFTQLPVFSFNILLPFLFLGLQLFSIYCGTSCLKYRESALHYSMLNQAIQIVGLTFYGFHFSYVSGLFLASVIDLSNSMEANFTTGISTFSFRYNIDKSYTQIELNLVATCLVFFIEYLIRKAKAQFLNWQKGHN